MKRILLWMAAAFVMTAAVCAQGTGAGKETRTLVAYFSATGTTEKAAKQIASLTGGALYKIMPEKAYTSADLDWRDKSSRSSMEMNDAKARPAIKGAVDDFGRYDVVYLGYPIWWNLSPRIINTFMESYDFTGKTVIPFATSGGSTISESEKALKKSYPDVKWAKGRLLNRVTEEEMKNWIQQQSK